MKKINLKKLANVGVGVSVVLYLIAWGIGTTGGMVAFVLLLAATSILLATLIEARMRTLSTFLFRLMLFFICWAAIFENRRDDLLEAAFGFFALLCGVVLVVRFVCFINKECVRDAEKHLAE